MNKSKSRSLSVLFLGSLLLMCSGCGGSAPFEYGLWQEQGGENTSILLLQGGHAGFGKDGSGLLGTYEKVDAQTWKLTLPGAGFRMDLKILASAYDPSSGTGSNPTALGGGTITKTLKVISVSGKTMQAELDGKPMTLVLGS